MNRRGRDRGPLPGPPRGGPRGRQTARTAGTGSPPCRSDTPAVVHPHGQRLAGDDQPDADSGARESLTPDAGALPDLAAVQEQRRLEIADEARHVRGGGRVLALGASDGPPLERARERDPELRLERRDAPAEEGVGLEAANRGR